MSWKSSKHGSTVFRTITHTTHILARAMLICVYMLMECPAAWCKTSHIREKITETSPTHAPFTATCLSIWTIVAGKVYETRTNVVRGMTSLQPSSSKSVSDNRAHDAH